MRIWIDITDAAHVVFFAPVVRRLEDDGHSVTLTARRFAGADTVLRRYGLGGVLTTTHRGGGTVTRLIGLVNRTAQLLGLASSGRYDVAARCRVRRGQRARASAALVLPQAGCWHGSSLGAG